MAFRGWACESREMGGLRRLAAFFDDGVWLLGVLGPGAVVEAYVFCAGDFEAEGDDGGGDAGAAGGGDRLLEVDLFGEEEVAEFFCGFETAVFDQFGEGDAGGSGHVAGG